MCLLYKFRQYVWYSSQVFLFVLLQQQKKHKKHNDP